MVSTVSNNLTPLNLTSASTIGSNSLNGLSKSDQMKVIKQLLQEIETLLQAQTGGSGGTNRAVNGGAPQANTPPLPGGNNLTQIGSALQQGGAQKGMTDFMNNDPAAFEAFQNALSHGDGNAATKILAGAIDSGKLSQKDGAAIGAQLQQTANANGGGKIDGLSTLFLAQALGGHNVLAQGHDAQSQDATPIAFVKR